MAPFWIQSLTSDFGRQFPLDPLDFCVEPRALLYLSGMQARSELLVLVLDAFQLPGFGFGDRSRNSSYSVDGCFILYMIYIYINASFSEAELYLISRLARELCSSTLSSFALPDFCASYNWKIS